MTVTSEQKDFFSSEIEEFLRAKDRQKRSNNFIKLSVNKKKELAQSVRLRAQAYGFETLITHALKNSVIPDPLMFLDDTVLIALDKTVERCIESLEQGIPPQEAGIIPLNIYWDLDLTDPYQKEIFDSIAPKFAKNAHIGIVKK